VCLPTKISVLTELDFWHCHTCSKLDSDTDARGRPQHLNSPRSATTKLGADFLNSNQIAIECDLNQNLVRLTSVAASWIPTLFLEADHSI
jgi:hypothetical protein